VLRAQVGQPKACAKEQQSKHARGTGQKIGRTPGTENRSGGTSTKTGSGVGTLTALKQDESHYGRCNQHMNNQYESM
jgi:hypothetical protein